MILGFGINAFAEIHSKWSANELVYYDGTNTIFAIRNDAEGLRVYDDMNLTFGDDGDATITYDETTDDVLEITCANGINIAGFIDWGTMDIGVATTTANPFVLEVHTEPLTVLTAGDTGMTAGIRSRYHITVAQTNSIGVIAIEGRLRVKHALAGGNHAAISGVIEASTATADWTGTATTQRSAGFFALDFDELGSLADDGWLTGVTINSSVHGDLSMAAVQFAGLHITTNAGKEAWEQGIVIDDDAAVIGIDVGTCTTGILLADDTPIVLGTTVATAATMVTLEFDETTTGIGQMQFGTTAAPMVYNTDPGAGGIAVIEIDTTHSAGAGNAVWLYGVSSSMIISGDGDSGTKLSPIHASILIDEAAVSSAYTVFANLTHDGTDSITGAAAVINADLYLESGNFEAEQTLQTAIFTLRSEGAVTVTCTSENFNVVLIKNLSQASSINSMIKVVSAGADDPTSMINFEGTADEGVFYFDADSDCVEDTGDPGAAGTGGTAAATHKIKCNYNGATFYLAGWADF